MARKIDPKSVRQRAFKMLDKMTEIKLEKVIKTLKKKFAIEEPYATSLWAAHRRINKENGNMVQVYKVHDVKQGKAVEPYIKIQNCFNPTPDACFNPVQAKKQYELELKNRIVIAKQL